MTGARDLGLEDLIALSMLIPNLLNRVLASSSDVDDWLPDSYADMTEGAIGGPVFPRFRLPGEVGWDSAAHQVGDWWSRAISDGIAPWSITSQVLTHEVLRCLDDAGLPRALAAPMYLPGHRDDGNRRTTHHTPESQSAGLTSAAGPDLPIDEPPSGCHITTVNWNLRDTSVSVVWLDPFADLPSARSRDVLSWVAKLLWSEPLEPSDVRYMLLAAGTLTAASLRDVLGAESSVHTLSIQDAARLGHATPGIVTDLPVRTIGPSSSPLIWLQLKG